MSRAGWLAVGALVVLAGCGAPERRPPAPAPARAVEAPVVPGGHAVFGGSSNVAAVRSASEVHAVRLLDLPDLDVIGERLLRGWAAPQVRGAPPRFTPEQVDGDLFGPLVAVDPDDVGTLTSLLTADDTYQFEGASACLFAPGVVVRFWVDDEPLDVLICFKCVELAAFRAGRRLGPLSSFDPGYRAVLDAVRRVFPDDEALRELAERRR